MPAEPTCQDPAVDYLDLVQWPAMAITVIAAWFTSSRIKGRRGIGFWCFLGSNVLWVEDSLSNSILVSTGTRT